MRVPTTHCLPLRFLPPRVTDLADVGLHIFNHFFPPNPTVGSFLSLFRYLPFVRTCLSSLFTAFLSFFLFLSYPETRARFTPKSGYFRSEKRAKKARIRYTKHEEGRFWSAVANEATRENERTSVRTERTVEQKGVEGGAARGGGREKGERIESKTATVAKGKWKPRICVRGERVKLGESVVSPEKWKFWTMAMHGKEMERENKAYPYYARSARAGSRKHLESFNRGRSKKLRDLSRHAANLKSVVKKFLIILWFEENRFKIFDTSYIIEKRAILWELI